MPQNYRNKIITAEEAAAKAVRSGDWVDYGFGGGFPELMDKALAARKDELTDVKICGGLVICPCIEAVESDSEPLPIRSYRNPSPIDIKIAERVVSEVPDGAVLSLGVGGVPYTVAKMLAESDVKDLGCHTGTISDPFMYLYQAGKLTNARKEIDTGRSTWNLAMGSKDLYDWLDREPNIFLPSDVDYVHSPDRIARMKNVISINGGVELDLMGQENAESAGSRQLSGLSLRERAEAMISVAHPDFREELSKYAQENFH